MATKTGTRVKIGTDINTLFAEDLKVTIEDHHLIITDKQKSGLVFGIPIAGHTFSIAPEEYDEESD